MLGYFLAEVLLTLREAGRQQTRTHLWAKLR